MKSGSTIRTRRAQAGIALLISIFILLLISVVAIALIVSSGTESALAGNYRSSTSVYYDALAGIEEARGRLAGKGPSGFKTTDPTTFLPPPGTPLVMGKTYYLINPVSGETITPWDQSSAYPDKQFLAEFGTLPTSPSLTALSIWNKATLNPGNYPGPLYKWVRINAVSEVSLNVDADNDSSANATVPLYYDNTNPSHPFSNNPIPGYQVIELTAFAVLPNGSQKILQYVVAPTPVTLPPFDAALTLSGSPGNSPVFHAPANNASYAVQGNDYDCSANPPASPPPASKAAIGLFGDYSGYSYNPDLTSITGGIPTNVPPGGTNTRPKYTGLGAAPPIPNPPDVEYLYAGQTPAQLDALVQTIVQNADVVIPSGPVTYPLPTVTGSSLTPLGMSTTNPLTVVVNGNLDISNWSNDGYGLLLVIGTFTYDPDTAWDGIILVIGQGVVGGNHAQYKEINGAMYVAKTRDATGNLLTGRIGGASVSFNDAMQGNGIYYSSCWIKKATPSGGYKVLSFHEIAQ